MTAVESSARVAFAFRYACGADDGVVGIGSDEGGLTALEGSGRPELSVEAASAEARP